MKDILIFVVMIVIILIELVFKLSLLFSISRRKEFLSKYSNTFVDYCNSRGEKYDNYTWLIRNSNRMQNEIGSFGIADYKPPFQNYYIRNYPVILNGINEVRQEFSMGISSQRCHLVLDTLLRYDGWIVEFHSKTVKSIFNPLVLLKDGIKRVLSIPFLILKTLGVISNNLLLNIRENYLFNLISSIITLIGIVSGLMTIILGWDETLSIISNTIR